MKKRARKGAILLITTAALSLAAFICALLVGFVLSAYNISQRNIDVQKQKIFIEGNAHRIVDKFLTENKSSFSVDLRNKNGDLDTNLSVIVEIKGDANKYVTLTDEAVTSLNSYLTTSHYTVNFKIYTHDDKTSFPIDQTKFNETDIVYLINNY